MNISTILITLCLSVLCMSATAQQTNHGPTRQAILNALPDGISAVQATSDQLAGAALETAFRLPGDRDANMTQVMVSLGEMTREGRFQSAPRYGVNNPPNRFYNRVLNLASSALDVSYTTYYGVTVQHIMALTAALREGQNFLNGAKSNAITRK